MSVPTRPAWPVRRRPESAPRGAVAPPAESEEAEGTGSETPAGAEMGSEETQPPDERRSTKLFALRAAIVSGKYAINAKNIARRVIDEL